MEPENSPPDPIAEASRVVELIEDIAADTEQDRRALLEIFLSASWCCRPGLDQ